MEKDFGVVVLGGYGNFGQVIVRKLAASGMRVWVAGRDLRKAETLAREAGARRCSWICAPLILPSVCAGLARNC